MKLKAVRDPPARRRRRRGRRLLGRRPPARRYGQRHAYLTSAADHRRRHRQRGRDGHHRARRRATASRSAPRRCSTTDSSATARLRHLDGDRGQGRGRPGRQEGRRPRPRLDGGPAAAAPQRRGLAPGGPAAGEAGEQDNLDDARGTDADPPGEGRPLQRDQAAPQAQQQVDDLAGQIRYATLVAPIDGIVTAVNIAAGPRPRPATAIVDRRRDLRGHRRRRRERHQLDDLDQAGDGRRSTRSDATIAGTVVRDRPGAPATAAASRRRRVVPGHGDADGRRRPRCGRA